MSKYLVILSTLFFIGCNITPRNEYIEGTSLFSDDVHNVNSVDAPDKIVPLNRDTPIMNENGYNIKVKPASVNVYTFKIAY